LRKLQIPAVVLVIYTYVNSRLFTLLEVDYFSRMKYENSIVIQLPVVRVIELFDNPDNMKYWQKGLQSFEHVSGTPGQPGAVSKLVYKMGNRMVEMKETITERDLPKTFAGIYEAKNVWNYVNNSFIDNGDNTTTYISATEFKFSGLMMKSIAILMPGAFKKQSQKYLEDFKAFAESQPSV
jgi:hypothetical protein